MPPHLRQVRKHLYLFGRMVTWGGKRYNCTYELTGARYGPLLGGSWVRLPTVVCFALVQSNAHPCEEASAESDTAWVSSGLRYWGLLIYGATLGVRTPCGLAFEDERAEGRAIVRVHILDPAALATSSQALSGFLAIWQRGGGPRYRRLISRKSYTIP